MGEELPPRKRTGRRVGRLLLAALALLVVAIIVNWRNITDIASGRRTVRSVVYGFRQAHLGYHGSFKFPPPSGPPTAKVKVLVVAQEGNPCHYPLVQLWEAVGALTADRVRVAYVGRQDLAKQLSAKPRELGCDSGALINGKSKFVLKDGDQQRTIYLTGPEPTPLPAPGTPSQATPAGGPPAGAHGGHGWTLRDLARVVNREIGLAYGTSGGLSVGAIKATQARLLDERLRQKTSPPSGTSPPVSG